MDYHERIAGHEFLSGALLAAGSEPELEAAEPNEHDTQPLDCLGADLDDDDTAAGDDSSSTSSTSSSDSDTRGTGRRCP